MKDYEKEIEKIFLDDEEDTLRRIKITYDNALVDVQKHVDKLQSQIDELMKDVDENDLIKQSQIRSKVYQLDYQKNLKKQINNYLDVIKDKDVKTIGDYLKRTYSNGFLTEQYRLMNEGIDIVMPINQKLLEKAVTYNTNNIPLSKRIYDNVEKAKKEIVNEISRSLSTGMSIDDTARNLQNTMGVSQRKAYQIAQNEGSRVRSDAVIDEMRESKKKGADIVKVWTAILDGKVRPHHRELDGKWAEVEGYFKYSGGEVFAPKQFGIASEDINCRCSLLSKPRWDLTETHTQMDSVSKKLVVVKNYQDWFDNVYTPSQTIVEKATQSVAKVNVVEKVVESTQKIVKATQSIAEQIEECKSIEDIDEVLHKTNWFWETTIDGETFNGTLASSVANADLESAKAIMRTYDKIYEKYPNLIGKLNGFSVTNLDPKTLGQTFVGYGRGGITYNTKIFSDFERSNRRYKRATENKWAPLGSNSYAEQIVAHEFGHAIDDYLTFIQNRGGTTKSGEARFFSSNIKTKILKESGVKSSYYPIREGLSEYATENAKEFFADAFSEYMTSSNPRPIAQAFGKVVDEYIRGI